MKTEYIHIRIDAATKEKFKKLAWKKRKTMSELIRAWVEAA